MGNAGESSGIYFLNVTPKHTTAIMVSYHGSQRNIHLFRQINHIRAEAAPINKRNPNEAQKQSDPRATVIKTQNRQTGS